MVSNDVLIDLVKRLENSVKSLEQITGTVKQQTQPILNNSTNTQNVQVQEIVRPFSEFSAKAKANLMDMLANAKKSAYPEQLEALTLVGIEAFCLHQDILEAHFNYPLPPQTEIPKLQNLFLEVLKKITPIVNDKPELNIHGQAITYGINSFLWITLPEGTVDVCQQYSDMIDNHRNKIFLKKVEEEIAWVKAWKDIFINLVKLVKMEYKVGLPWNCKSTKKFDELYSTLGVNLKNFSLKKNFEYNINQQTSNLNTVNQQITTEQQPSPTINLKYGSLIAKGEELLSKLSLLSSEIEINGIADVNALLNKGIRFLLSVISRSKGFKFNTNLQCLTNVIVELGKELKTISTNRELNIFYEVLEHIFNSFYWITKNEMCLDIAQAYVDMVDNPGNKILMKKVPSQTDWIKSIKEFLKEMIKTIKEHFRFGLEFDANGKENIEQLAVIEYPPVSSQGSSSSAGEIFVLSKDGFNKAKTTTTIENAVVVDNIKEGRILIPDFANLKSISISNSSDLKVEFKTENALSIEISNSKNIVFNHSGKEFKY